MIPKSAKNEKSGMVFVATLLLIMVLAVIILEFNHESRIKLHLADNFHNTVKALSCAEAGVEISMAILRQNDNILADKKLVSFVSGMVQIPVDGGYCTLSIADESGKININALRASSGQLVRSRIDQMLRLIDLLNDQFEEHSPISYALIPAIIDWVDLDDDVTTLSFVRGENSGAENDYYQDLQDSYPCKNAPFDVLGELLSVRGMTKEIFHGRAGKESEGIKPTDGIKRFLTVYGDAKININEASPMVIQSLSEKIDSALAQNIVEQRRRSPYENVRQLQEISGMTPEIYGAIRGLITVRPTNRYHTVTITGVSGQFIRKIQIVVTKDRDTSQVRAIWRREF